MTPITTLPNAPLIYALCVVRFPPIPKVGRFVDGFHDVIRNAYPFKSELMTQSINASFGPEGLSVDKADQPLWQFTSSDRTHAFVLGPDFLVLHASGRGYAGHSDFAGRLEAGLSHLKAVPEIGIEIVTAVGFRYVDLVAPREGEDVSAYLSVWALPAALPKLSSGHFLEFKEGVYVASFTTEIGILRLQVLRRPPTTFPPELDTPFVRQNEWVPPMPPQEFALIDIDHGTGFSGPQPMDPQGLAAHIVALREVAYDLFSEAATAYAFKVWRNEA